ncbi:quercetin dioxygenase-like cupin family protein [Methanofollis sp. W23]|uniref:cupin domain-containing protein n=1 Tax=Methanofollis sp. W23 TaxID=2817849 RepID=UPI001AE36E78|nr:cupin domain-containing protein [Methanofollis sp. W23]MBP2145117.1 quercetin dioxygenase-like cupin family protein [Methanofollis sp. W23]
MHRTVLLILICFLLSAGCVSPTPSAEGAGEYAGLIGEEETPEIPANYSLGTVVIPPGNATPLHRMAGSTEFVFLTAGEAEIRCDNQTVTARAGESVLLPEGVLQSIASVGERDLRYVDVIEPPFTVENEISGDDLALLAGTTDGVPVVIPDPRAGAEWNLGADMRIYTLANPVLTEEAGLPIGYSVAYVELLPGGSIRYNRLNGSSEVVYVLDGEVEVFTPAGGGAVRVAAGSAAYVPPDEVKGYRNVAATNSTVLSFVDPAWTPERTEMLE